MESSLNNILTKNTQMNHFIKTGLCIFIFFLPVFSIAQKTVEDFPLTIGERYLEIGAVQKRNFDFEKTYVSLKKDHEIIYLQSFDKTSLNLISAKRYKKFFPANIFYEATMWFNEKLYFFYSSYDRKEKLERLFYIEILEDGTFNGEGKLLAQSKNKLDNSPIGNYKHDGTDHGRKFYINKSADESKLLVNHYIARPRTEGLDYKDQFGIEVYNSELQPIWSDLVTMIHRKLRLKVLDFAVDAKGQVYFGTIKIDKEVKTNGRGSKPFNRLEVVKFSEDKEKPKVAEIEFKKEQDYLSALRLLENEDGNMVVCGTTSTTYDNQSTGVFMTLLSPEMKILSTEALSNESTDFLQLDEAICDDNNLLLFAITVRQRRESYDGGVNGRITLHYNDYGVLQIYKFDKTGKYLKKDMIVINESRSAQGFGFFKPSCYFFTKFENKYYFFHGEDQMAVEVWDLSDNSKTTVGLGDIEKRVDINLRNFDYDKFTMLSDGLLMEGYCGGKRDVLFKFDIE